MNYLDKFNLQSKVSLITGGAGGIGKEICKALLDAGSKVILADIDERKGLKIVESLSKKIRMLEHKILPHSISHAGFLIRSNFMGNY